MFWKKYKVGFYFYLGFDDNIFWGLGPSTETKVSVESYIFVRKARSKIGRQSLKVPMFK